LSEAMARVFCEPTISGRHVLEAKRLLKASVLKIEQTDIELEEVRRYFVVKWEGTRAKAQLLICVYVNA